MELTKTEFLVCAYTAAGYEPKETANILFRSYHTIACHIKKVRVRHHLKNVAELTMHFVLENGDPRKFIATLFIFIQLSTMIGIEDDSKRRRKIARKGKITLVLKVKNKAA